MSDFPTFFVPSHQAFTCDGPVMVARGLFENNALTIRHCATLLAQQESCLKPMDATHARLTMALEAIRYCNMLSKDGSEEVACMQSSVTTHHLEKRLDNVQLDAQVLCQKKESSNVA